MVSRPRTETGQMAVKSVTNCTGLGRIIQIMVIEPKVYLLLKDFPQSRTDLGFNRT